MKDKNLDEYKKMVAQQLKKLRPLFAHAAKGNFSFPLTLPLNKDDELAELYTGIQTMSDVIKQKISDVEIINNVLTFAQSTAHIGIWNWDVLKNKITWSDELCRLFGVSQNNVPETFDQYISYLHPEDQKYIKKVITDSYKTKKPFSTNHRVLLPHGTVRHIRSISKIVKNKKGKVIKMMGTAQDVTKEMEALKSLKTKTDELKAAHEVSSRLATIVEHSSDAIVSKNLNGIILSWNKSASKIFGYSEKEAVGKHISIIIPKELLSEEHYIISQIKKGIPIQHFETVRVHKSGKRIDISLSISPIKNFQGIIVGASKIARDITEKKELEQQKEDFVAMVSHELKTPVTSLKMYTHILSSHLSKMSDAKGKEFADHINNQLDRLTKLIIDLLDITRVQKGKLEYNKSSFVFGELIEEIADELEKTSMKHKIIMKGAFNAKAFADKDRIRQVMINLITNAIKYSPAANKITINVKKTASKVTVCVQDYGIGIPRDQQGKIFNRFYQVHSPQSKTYPGLGLGLYICKEIIEKNNGKLWVRSKVGKGSSFCFCIPTTDNS